MRDERVGAFGVAGGILVLLLKYAALTAMPDRAAALICAATAGAGPWPAVVTFLMGAPAVSVARSRTMPGQRKPSWLLLSPWPSSG